MKKIPLNHGRFALVDDEDYDWLMSLGKWYAHKDGNTFYAVRVVNAGGRRVKLRMHREITQAKKGKVVDHKDGDGLNNQKANLRECETAENTKNRIGNVNSASKYKGVQKSDKKWRVTIFLNGNRFHLGVFSDEIKAAIAYNEAAIKYHGEFARLNEIPE